MAGLLLAPMIFLRRRTTRYPIPMRRAAATKLGRFFSCWLWLPSLALAGPPFATDDPEPTPYRGYEIFLFSEGVRTGEGTEAVLPGFELNYGAAPDLQLAFAIGEAVLAPHGESVSEDYDGTELSAKYRFVHEDEEGWIPQIAIYPTFEFANAHSKPLTYLPLWLQKSIDGWEVFGGGGPKWNPESGGKTSFFVGIAALHGVTENLELGAEVFRQTAETHDDQSATGFNLAALYDLSAKWHVVGSAGRGLTQASQTNEFSYYIGLELTTP